VRLPDGRRLNHEVVRAGYAWWFRRYSSDATLAALESEARAAQRGLWADPQS
jgi:micrococcal nuclease